MHATTCQDGFSGKGERSKLNIFPLASTSKRRPLLVGHDPLNHRIADNIGQTLSRLLADHLGCPFVHGGDDALRDQW